jgi:protein-S-isoprenylcysteine O-methyltransferase Ste14
MPISFEAALISAIWLVWVLSWSVFAIGAKPSQRIESAGSRLLHTVPLWIACALMLSRSLPVHWLYGRFVPATRIVYATGLVLLACGIAFTLWARVHLGRNWSGIVTVKEGHELIRSGPYRVVRHPIYSGLLLAVLGTAIAIGEWRGLVALAFVLAAFLRKIRLEERWMREAFGEAYVSYCRDVPALVPGIRGSA